MANDEHDDGALCFREAFETSAAAFFRKAIESGRRDELFGDDALEALAVKLVETADEIVQESGDDNEPAALLLMHASAAITFLAGQVQQDAEVIEGLAVDLDDARKGARGDGD